MHAHTRALCVLLLLPLLYAHTHAYTHPHGYPSPAKDVYDYSGYLQVNATTGASLFYWFFPAQNNNVSAPLILWLQGGPGSSSILYGLLNELGPFTVDDNMQMVDNPYTWNKKYHLLFVDQPVGTGFSFIGTGDYVRSGQQMARDLYTALTAFYKLYPNYLKNDFYIFGESYGGKYVPYIANYILQQGSSFMPLVGIGIGNGITDPVMQLVYDEQAYQLGLIDPQQRDYVTRLQQLCAQQTMNQQWETAADTRAQIFEFLSNATGHVNFFDVRTYGEYDLSTGVKFLSQPDVRKNLHVGNHTFNTNSTPISDALKSDMMKSLKGLFPYMLDHIKVLLYQGQFDLRDGAAGNEAWIETIPWSGRDAYNNAQRRVWRVSDNVAGYVKNYKTLTQIVVVGAGHMVPMNQPLHAQVMVENFIENNAWK